MALHLVAGVDLSLPVGWVDKRRALGGEAVLVAVSEVGGCSIPPGDLGE